jgi:phage portal protein BeeE
MGQSSSMQWYLERKAEQAADEIRKSVAQRTIIGTQAGREATPMQRAWATGHTAGYQRSNSFAQLDHDKSWTNIGTNTNARQWMLSSVCAYDRSMEVHKSVAQDAPAEQRKPIQNHPAIKLLKHPNPVVGYHAFMWQVAKQFGLTGGCVIWEVRNEEGIPVELWVLPRAWLTFWPPSERCPLGRWRVVNPRGIMGYWGGMTVNGITLAGGFELDVRDTINVYLPHSLYPGEPYSQLEACAEIIDIGEKADKATWSCLVNAIRPGLILSVESENPLGPEQLSAIEKTLAELKGGENNAGKTLVLQNVKKDSLGTPMSDLNSVDLRTQNQQMMLAAHGVPPMAAGIRTDVGSYSGDAATINTYVEQVVQPMLNFYGGVLTHRFQRYWGDDFELEYSAKRMDDVIIDGQRQERYLKGYVQGVFTLNQVLKVFKEPPATINGVPDPSADERKPPAPPPGMPGAMPGQDAGGTPTHDLNDDVPDDTSTGVKRPELQQASGNRLPSFLMNGSANGVAH